MARGHGLAVEALLQVVEATATSPAALPTRSSPSRTALEADAVDDLGKGIADLVAGARVEPHALAGGRDLHADAVPLPFGGIGVELGHELRDILVLERMGQHQRPEYRHVLGQARPRARAVEPGEQLAIGRRQPVPDLLDLGRVRPGRTRPAPASRAGPRRRPARPPVTSLSSAQRPVASSVSSQPATTPGSSAFAGRLQRRPPPRPAAARRPACSAAPARSAPPSRRDRRRNRRTSRTAPGRCGRARARGSAPAWRPRSSSAPVSAARPQPRSGSGTRAEIVQHQRQLDVALRGVEQPVEQLGEGFHRVRPPREGSVRSQNEPSAIPYNSIASRVPSCHFRCLLCQHRSGAPALVRNSDDY